MGEWKTYLDRGSFMSRFCTKLAKLESRSPVMTLGGFCCMELFDFMPILGDVLVAAIPDCGMRMSPNASKPAMDTF